MADLTGLARAVQIMDRLRSAGGCPWDAEQTHQSLKKYLLEEAYEAVDAIDSGDRDHLREELGDVLLQVLFHARIAAEHSTDPWQVDDVANELADKLVRRHPHVFADVHVDGADEVNANWETIKASEKRRTGTYDGVVWAQPALSLAAAVLRRAARAGTGLELDGPPEDAEERIGRDLLQLAEQASAVGVDPELALRRVVRKAAGAE
ncbi:MazG family protein [Antricoccus suffuscus]|uniref:MazG family protein n=1 Tax=Antricoccus suffuscus TaxID=1629062 RepID=UPI00192D39E4|nr:MazG family protein [Antricoccus suffuscus]